MTDNTVVSQQSTTAPAGNPAPRGVALRRDLGVYSFLVAFGALFVAFTLYPFLAALFLSFTDNSPLNKVTHWVWVDNFARILLRDRVFLDSVQATVVYVVLLVPTQLVLGLALALFVNKKLLGHELARVAFFAPFVLSVSVVGILWGWILDTRYGLLNLALGALGLPSRTPWLSNVNWVMVGIVLTSLWWHVGFSMVLFLAGLQDIPNELREAAVIDGASSRQVLQHITLPLLRPIGVLIFILTTIDAIKVFGLPWFMTAGGPAGSSTTIVYDLYLNFQSTNMGYASAIGFLLLLIMLVVAIIRQLALREELT